MLSGMTRFSGPCQPALSSCSTMRFLAHGRFGKVGKDELEQFLADGVGDVPHRPACRRLDEACHIEPLEPMVAECDRPLADRRTHTPRTIGFRPMRCDRFAWSLRGRISFLHRHFCVFKLVAPAMLPPGRFRLATTVARRPGLTTFPRSCDIARARKK